MSLSPENNNPYIELRTQLDARLSMLERNEETLPQLDAIANETIKQIAVDEITENDMQTQILIGAEATSPKWNDLGVASSMAFARRPKAYTDQQNAELEALLNDRTITESALGQDSKAYAIADAAYKAKVTEFDQTLGMSDEEKELEQLIQIVGQPVPILAMKGLTERVAAKSTPQELPQDQTVANVEEIIEETVSTQEEVDEQPVVTDVEQETQSSTTKKEPKFKQGHKRGAGASSIVEFVRSQGGTATRRAIMEYMDSIANNPNGYKTNVNTRFSAFVQQLHLQKDKLGITNIELDKTGEDYVLNIAVVEVEQRTTESTQSTEIEALDIQEYLSNYLAYRNEHDEIVNGTFGITLLSDAILGMLKDPAAWSDGQDDVLWLTQEDRAAIAEILAETPEEILSGVLDVTSRRAYAASRVIEALGRNRHWVEEEMMRYDAANDDGQYQQYINALAIMFKLVDMTDKERKEFVGKQLQVEHYIRQTLKSHRNGALDVDLDHLPVRTVGHFVEIDTVIAVSEDDEIGGLTQQVIAEQNTTPELETPEISVSIVMTAVASQVVVEQVAEAPAAVQEPKRKGIFSGREKLTSEQRAKNKLTEDGLHESIDEAIEIIESKGIMDPTKEGAITGTKAQALIKPVRDTFLTEESMRRTIEAGVTPKSFNRDGIVSRVDMIVDMVFNKHQRLLRDNKAAAKALRVVIAERIAKYDARLAAASAK